MSIYRSHLVPVAIALLLAGALAIFWDSGSEPAGWTLLVSAVALPVVVGILERERIPEGPWWIAPALTVLLLVLLVVTFASIVVSRI